MATSPMAENLITRICSVFIFFSLFIYIIRCKAERASLFMVKNKAYSAPILIDAVLLLVEYRVGRRIVVHLHLSINLHILSSSLDVLQELIDGSRKIHLLFEEYVELSLALSLVLFRSLRALHLLLHVIDLEGKDAETVNCPCRTFGIDACIIQHLYILVNLAEVRINLLYEISTVLVALIDSALQDERLCRVDLRVADDILEMPLNGVNPALEVETVLDGTFLEWIIDRSINVVFDVIIGYRLIKNLVSVFCKCHTV